MRSFFNRPHRFWERTPYGRTFRYDNHRSQSFILMSYNILAQTLLERHPHLYRKHTTEFLEWTHRLNCLRNEILTIRPAILCLQEVQDSHLEHIENALKPLNYAKPLYKKRTGHNYDDGCAIFYDPKQFELIDHHYVEFYQPGVKILDRYNVAIIAKFASCHLDRQQFIVSTTHLLYNPHRDDIRTAQLQVLLAELDRMSVHNDTQEPLPIILTGDFNSLPFSGPHQLIDKGRIDSDKNLPHHLGIMDDCKHMNVTLHQNRHSTALYHSVQNNGDSQVETTIESVQQSGLPYSTGQFWHVLNFTSTLEMDDIASTYQDKWITVDYIFYTKYMRQTVRPLEIPPKFSSLQLLGNYRLPFIQDCQRMGPIPNVIYGSDHYSMASEFVLISR